jgi:Fe-S-cluster containining protein
MLSSTMSFIVSNRYYNRAIVNLYSTNIHWENGLKFGCTGCGKCCQNDGEVWFDSDEFAELADHLNLSHNDVLDQYSEKVMSGWVKIKNKVVQDNLGSADRCIFLDDDGKKCTVYEARPTQCRTYPYWPRLMNNESAWLEEAVDIEKGKLWTPENGGCEGINHKDAPIVPVKTIHRNHELYKMYNDVFPFISSGDDKNRLLAKTGVIRGVVRSTREWVKDFVIKYNLCPFAESVFTKGNIRYRVFFGTDKQKIKERLAYEVLQLLTIKEEEVATTLLMLPFALLDFEEFYEFSLELEDKILPKIEESSQGPKKDVVTTKSGKEDKKSLLQRIKSKKEKKEEGCPVNHSSGNNDIQLAFFHPGYCWSDTEFDDPINFEKRAPFPTINLLRAARIREYANTDKTKKIANANLDSLENAGSKKLTEEMERIIRIALEDQIDA